MRQMGLKCRRKHCFAFVMCLAIAGTAAGMVPAQAQPTPREIQELNKRSGALFEQGKHGEMLSVAGEMLRKSEVQLGKNHPVTAVSFTNVGIAQANLGLHAAAEESYQRAIAIWERRGASGRIEVANVLNSLGIVYREQGRYIEAEATLTRSLVIRETELGKEHHILGENLVNLANTYRNQYRYADAEPLLKRAISLIEKAHGPVHHRVAIAVSSLAGNALDQGLLAEAEAHYRRALDVYRQTSGPEHPNTVVALGNVAYLADKQGRDQEAERLYVESIALHEKVVGPEHHLLGRVLNNYAAFHFDRGRFERAESIQRRSLAIREKGLGPGHPGVAHDLRGIGRSQLGRKQWSAALTTLRRAIAIQTDRYFLSSRIGTEGVVGDSFVFADVTNASWGLAAHDPAQRAALAAEAFEAAQWAGQQSAGAALAQMAARAAAIDPRLAERVRARQDLERQVKRLDQELLHEVTRSFDQRQQTTISDLRRESEGAAVRLKALSAEITQTFPAYADLASPRPLALTEAQRLLRTDEALVVFLVHSAGTDDAAFVWAATRDLARWHRLPIGLQALSDKVSVLRGGLDAPDLKAAAAGGKLFDLGLAHDLHGVLLAPVADLLKGKRHVIVVPSGSLTSLPFHLLVTDRPTTPKSTDHQLDAYRKAAWLIRRHAVTVLPSVSSLKALRVLAKASPASKPLVGFGDPIFGRSPAGRAPSPDRANRTRSYAAAWRGSTVNLEALRGGLAPLPETAAELKAVGQSLHADVNQLHLSERASETIVKSLDLSPYRVVYFATHGLVAGEIKGLGEPALVLTLPVKPTAADDGLLTASEVAQLKLNADWVVLSACNTAAGDAPGADALSGLARAFFYAGARALMVSHWQVDSAAAVRLTTTTFAALQKEPELSRSEALRRAMIAMIDDASNPWNAYPDFWAPFSVVGEGGGTVR